MKIIAILFAACALLLGAASTRAQATFIAYDVPAKTPSDQNGLANVTVGMDFEIANEIIITKLGVFDAGSDGLTDGITLTARIWDRSQEPPVEIATMDFPSTDPGVLVGGSRFKPLAQPLRLPAGFQGTISGDGWADTDSINNSFGNVAGVLWTVNDGNGSILFVGRSRYGTGIGAFPGTVDTGPAARYASSTFEFQTTPAILPGKPALSLKGGDKQIALSWPAVLVPAPAAKYSIARSASVDGPFKVVGEVATNAFTDTNVVNGTVYFYTVTGISATGRSGPVSDIKSGAAYLLEKDKVIAYFTPGGLAGNQAFGGSLGMDFDIQNPIVVTRLGVFDDKSDGLKLDLAARIFDRDSFEVLAELTFTADDPGVLVEGMRFKALAKPLTLPIGFHGVIEADGYGSAEPLLNSGGNATIAVWKLNDGNGSVLFVGRSRYSTTPATFPDTQDGGGPARYAAGTFEYQTTPPQFPGVPTLSIITPYEDRLVTLNWSAVINPLPAAKYEIFRSTAGVYAKIGETASLSFRDITVTNGVNYCYKVHAVSSAGIVGPDSAEMCATPDVRKAGTAYLVPDGLAGNQNLANGAVGMDFDVAHPIKVTKLGVFDDSGDGLNMNLTAVLYDRATRKILASQEFTPAKPGDLVGGSRFLPLATPIILDEGFQGSMVIWYSNGTAERLFNTFGRPDPAVADLQTFAGGSIVFVGASRYGTSGSFPGTVDTGPANRYAGGTFSFEPTVIDRPTFIAYAVADKSAGNQDLGGTTSLGMDFDVANEIIVTKLGVFDADSDGLKTTLSAKLWNRNDKTNPLVSIEFTAGDPGVLVGGSRFKTLSRALHLPRGFQGTISADGYNKVELARNSFGVATNITWTQNAGLNGSVVFVGKSRYGTGGQYPANVDGGPTARYAAGTFEFQTTPPALPGQPVVTVQRPYQDALVTLNWLAVTNPLPAVKYEVFRSGTNGSGYVKIGETTEVTYKDTAVANGAQYFYVVRAIGAGGEAGDNSAGVSAIPAPIKGGIAYIVRAGLPGNQVLGGSGVGMDFDVANPIKITQLGVFDDSSDGIKQTLTAVLYDRASRSILATQEFNTTVQGTLVDGSRFLPLPRPITLNPGFQGSIVIWYSAGGDEKLFNIGVANGNPTNLNTFEGGSIAFVGGGRYGAAGGFPGTVDGGPANRYAGGTFVFEPVSATAGVKLLFTVAANKLKLTWTGGGVLESATSAKGPWSPVAGAASGLEIAIAAEKARFYRIRQ